MTRPSLSLAPSAGSTQTTDVVHDFKATVVRISNSYAGAPYTSQSAHRDESRFHISKKLLARRFTSSNSQLEQIDSQDIYVLPTRHDQCRLRA
jgi:hypothetical protein